MIGNTIIGAAFESKQIRNLVVDGGTDAFVEPDAGFSRRLFKIRAADAGGHRSSASILVHRMYASRGYLSTSLPEQQCLNDITLVANDSEETIGTMSVGFDKPGGLLVDALFPDEVNALRRAGRKVCEFTKLAVDNPNRSRRVLASLFHVAYIYAHRLRGFDRLLIEVNPRHVLYYQQMLGFTRLGPQRLNQRVNAPAVLLALDFEHAQHEIGRLAGRAELFRSERSLYPYFFSIAEEAGIVGRLQHDRSVTGPTH